MFDGDFFLFASSAGNIIKRKNLFRSRGGKVDIRGKKKLFTVEEINFPSEFMLSETCTYGCTSWWWLLGRFNELRREISSARSQLNLKASIIFSAPNPKAYLASDVASITKKKFYVKNIFLYPNIFFFFLCCLFSPSSFIYLILGKHKRWVQRCAVVCSMPWRTFQFLCAKVSADVNSRYDKEDVSLLKHSCAASLNHNTSQHRKFHFDVAFFSWSERDEAVGGVFVGAHKKTAS